MKVEDEGKKTHKFKVATGPLTDFKSILLPECDK